MKTTLAILEAQFKRKRNNAAALAAVKKAHPYSKMTLATVNWYRNKFRRDGMKIPMEHELR
jgi:hypothetical protein